MTYPVPAAPPGYWSDPIVVEHPAADLDHLVDQGYLVVPGLLAPRDVAEMAAAVDRLVAAELTAGGRPIDENGYYVADILEKDDAFGSLVGLPIVPLARALLGPRVAMRAVARVAFEGEPGVGLVWHIHMPVVPDPLPPWFSYPHQVHVLIYLDAVDDPEGALRVAPGSHLDATLDRDRVEGAPHVDILPRAGDAVVIHGNLWHRTVPATAGARRRRVLIVGLWPAWTRTERAAVPGQVEVPVARQRIEALRASGGRDLDDLLEGFRW